MIKRSGVEVMNERTNNVKVARHILSILKNKQYISNNGSTIDIQESLDAAIKGTVLYKNPLQEHKYVPVVPTLEVVNETTTQAAMRLLAAGKTNLVALNFASAHCPGGGFIGGALAQEEDLCRSSGLYPCLKSKPIFYNENILCGDDYYTDNIIYSPNVPFITDDAGIFLDTPYNLSIITAPAPCIRGMENIDESLLVMKLIVRAEKILQIAYESNHKNIILGAWGTGAFGNSVVMVANIFVAALKSVPSFEHVCFAVYDNKFPPTTYETFKEIFK